MSSFKCYKVKVDSVQQIVGADKIVIATVGADNFIVAKGVQPNDVGIVFLQDACLTEYAVKLLDATFLKKGGRVKVVKLRGVYSSGLLSFNETLLTKFANVKVGKEIVDDTIYTQYEEHEEVTKGLKKDKFSFKNVAVAKHVDTEQYNYNKDTIKNMFNCGCTVDISVKYHGTSAVTHFGKVLNKHVCKKYTFGWFKELFKFMLLNKNKNKHIINTRNCFIGTVEDGVVRDNYRLSAAKHFFNKLKENETVYYEIVGFGDTAPIMSPNGKVEYSYGLEKGCNTVYVYAIGTTTNGVFKPYSTSDMYKRCNEIGVKTVMPLARFDNKHNTFDAVDRYIAGVIEVLENNTTGTFGKYENIDEGVVIKVTSVDCNTVSYYKAKSKKFYIAEGVSVRQ